MRIVSADAVAAEFQQHRSHLLAVGYRLTGSWVDAEDAVQESWLRLQRVEPPRDLRARLTTVVGHLCLDRLRSATARRERYVGPWLPEPVVTPLDGAGGPADDVVRDEGVRMAALVVLERLTPEQRVALVLLLRECVASAASSDAGPLGAGRYQEDEAAWGNVTPPGVGPRA